MRREDFGKCEVWQGGQFALYAADNSFILLQPIETKTPNCACGAGCNDGVCTDSEIG